MKNQLTAGVVLAVLLAGCSADSMQRGAFEAFQSISLADCQRTPSAACPPRTSYDDVVLPKEQWK